MLNRVLSEIIKNLNRREEISKLGFLIKKMDNLILNDKEIYEKTIKNPFRFMRPIKGNQSYKTHNFIYNECFTKSVDKLKIIISMDSFCNESNKNNFDVALFYNNVNINEKVQNTLKNISKCYRITACGIKIKAETIKYEIKKLKNIPNVLFSSVLKYDESFLYFFDGSNNNTKKINNGEFETEKQNIEHGFGVFNLDKPNTDFIDIKSTLNESVYFVCDCENFDFLQMIKHVEHIPLQEYEEILNNDINENVW